VTETGHFVDPNLFVPDSTKDNYADAARMAAKANGTTVAEEWASIVAQFEANHERDGAAGWNHLAAWAKSVDPETVGGTPDPTQVRKARQLASAIQDPAEADEIANDSEAKDAVEHAHRTNAARQETGPGSPAGTDPAPVPEGDDDKAKRAARKPSRNAAQSTPQENR
jgi:hypothetical protein